MRNDLLLAAGLGLVALIELTVQDVNESLVWVCAAISCACLALRSRAPLAAALGVFIFFSTPLAFLGQPMPSLGDAPNSAATAVALMVAVYSLGAHAARGPGLLGLAAAELLMAAHVALIESTRPATTNDYLAAAVVPTLLPFLAGVVVARRRRLKESEQRTAELRIAAAEERSRIARDVHDLVAHSVSVMVVQAEAGEALLGTAPERAAQSLRDVQRAGRDALVEMRRTVAALRSGEPSRPGGLADLDLLVESMSALGLPVELRVPTPIAPLAADVDAAAYRVVREALTNSLRHSDRTGTHVSITQQAGFVSLVIEDLGAPPRPAGEPGFGLRGLEEAVQTVGGRIEISAPTGGHRLEAILPASR